MYAELTIQNSQLHKELSTFNIQMDEFAFLQLFSPW